jgi:hypothetical protein
MAQENNCSTEKGNGFIFRGGLWYPRHVRGNFLSTTYFTVKLWVWSQDEYFTRGKGKSWPAEILLCELSLRKGGSTTPPSQADEHLRTICWGQASASALLLLAPNHRRRRRRNWFIRGWETDLGDGPCQRHRQYNHRCCQTGWRRTPL